MSGTQALIGEVNEGSSAIIELSFFDENDQPVQPSLVTWRVDDVLTSTNYAIDQTLVPTGTKENIIIQPSWNNIIDARREREYRRLTVTYEITSARIGTDELRWAVRNLRYI